MAGFFLVFDDNLQTIDGADVSSTVMTLSFSRKSEATGSTGTILPIRVLRRRP